MSSSPPSNHDSNINNNDSNNNTNRKKPPPLGPEPTLLSRKEVDALYETTRALMEALHQLQLHHQQQQEENDHNDDNNNNNNTGNNTIHYMVTGGTLLGAVRQHSILFCDDDVDVAMFYRDGRPGALEHVRRYLPRYLPSTVQYQVLPWPGGDRVRHVQYNQVFCDVFGLRRYQTWADFSQVINTKQNGQPQSPAYVQSLQSQVQRALEGSECSDDKDDMPFWQFDTRKAIELWPKEVYRDHELWPLDATLKLGPLTGVHGPRMPLTQLHRAFGPDCLHVYYPSVRHATSSSGNVMTATSLMDDSNNNLPPRVQLGGTWEHSTKLPLQDEHYIPMQPTARAQRRFTLHNREHLLEYVQQQQAWEDAWKRTVSQFSLFQKDIARPRRTIYLDGVFDLLHLGHLQALQHAAQLGDRLVVGATGDEDATGYKRQPLVPQAERVALVEALACVDRVICPCPLVVTQEFLQRHKLDLVVHGFVDAADRARQEPFFRVPRALGQFQEIPYSHGTSTTDRMRHIGQRWMLEEYGTKEYKYYPPTESNLQNASVPTDWRYLTEGGRHVIFSYHGSDVALQRQLLRVVKCDLLASGVDENETTNVQSISNLSSNRDYLVDLVYPCLTPFIDVPVQVKINSNSWAQSLCQQFQQHSNRNQKKHANDISHRHHHNQITATLWPNYRCTFPNCRSQKPDTTASKKNVTWSVEIKPKAGYAAFSPLVHPTRRIKYTTSRYQLLQRIQSLSQPQETLEDWSHYEPQRLFSRDLDQIRSALSDLQTCPRNNFKIWKNDPCSPPRQQDVIENPEIPGSMGQEDPLSDGIILDMVAQILHREPFLQKLLDLQELDWIDADGAIFVYQHLVEQYCMGDEAKAQRLIDETVQFKAPCQRDSTVFDYCFLMHQSPIAYPLDNIQKNQFKCEDEGNKRGARTSATTSFQKLKQLLNFVNDFRQKSVGVQSHDHSSKDLDNAREHCLRIVQDDLGMSELIYLLQNWLLSLTTCDVSFFVCFEKVASHGENNQERFQNCSQPGRLCYRKDGASNVWVSYSIKVIDCGAKPAVKLSTREGKELKYAILNNSHNKRDNKMPNRNKGKVPNKLKWFGATLAKATNFSPDLMYDPIPLSLRMVMEPHVEKARKQRQASWNEFFPNGPPQWWSDFLQSPQAKERDFAFDTSAFDLKAAFLQSVGMSNSFDLSRLHEQQQECPYPVDHNLHSNHQELKDCLLFALTQNYASFQEVYDEFVRTVCVPNLFEDTNQDSSCTEMYYQAFPCIRIVRPKDFSIGPHADVCYGHHPGCINFYVPLTAIGGTASLFLESRVGSEDWHPIEGDYGSIKRFNGGSCLHWTTENMRNQTRVSLDFRLITEEVYRGIATSKDQYRNKPGYYVSCQRQDTGLWHRADPLPAPDSRMGLPWTLMS